METKTSLITIRPYQTLTDKSFVLATFLKGLYYGDSWFSLIPKDTFMTHYHAFLERFIESPGVDISMACLAEDPDVIIGYCIHTNTVVHMIFVKKAWRRIGVAKSLLPNQVTAVSHLTDLGRRLLSKLPEAVFNPFVL